MSSFVDDRRPTIWRFPLGKPPRPEQQPSKLREPSSEKRKARPRTPKPSTPVIEKAVVQEDRYEPRLKPIEGDLLRKLYRATVDERRRSEEISRLPVEEERTFEGKIEEQSPAQHGFYLPQIALPKSKPTPEKAVTKPQPAKKDPKPAVTPKPSPEKAAPKHKSGKKNYQPAEETRVTAESVLSTKSVRIVGKSGGEIFVEVPNLTQVIEASVDPFAGEEAPEPVPEPKLLKKQKKKQKKQKEQRAEPEEAAEDVLFKESVSKGPSRASEAHEEDAAGGFDMAGDSKPPPVKEPSLAGFEEIGQGWTGPASSAGGSKKEVSRRNSVPLSFHGFDEVTGPPPSAKSSRKGVSERNSMVQSFHEFEKVNGPSPSTTSSKRKTSGIITRPPSFQAFEQVFSERSVAQSARGAEEFDIGWAEQHIEWAEQPPLSVRTTKSAAWHEVDVEESHKSHSGGTRHSSSRTKSAGWNEFDAEEGKRSNAGRSRQSTSRRSRASKRSNNLARGSPLREDGGWIELDPQASRHSSGHTRRSDATQEIDREEVPAAIHVSKPPPDLTFEEIGQGWQEPSRHSSPHSQVEEPYLRPTTVFAGRGWISPHPLSCSPTEIASPPQSKIVLPSEAFPQGATMTYEEWRDMQEQGLKMHRNISATESSHGRTAKLADLRYKFAGWGHGETDSKRFSEEHLSAERLSAERFSARTASYRAPTVESDHSNQRMPSRHSKYSSHQYSIRDEGGSRQASSRSSRHSSGHREEHSSHSKRESQHSDSHRSRHSWIKTPSPLSRRSFGFSEREIIIRPEHESRHSSRHKTDSRASRHSSGNYEEYRPTSKLSRTESGRTGSNSPRSEGHSQRDDGPVSRHSRVKTDSQASSNKSEQWEQDRPASQISTVDTRSLGQQSRARSTSDWSHQHSQPIYSARGSATASRSSSERVAQAMEEGRNVWSNVPEPEDDGTVSHHDQTQTWTHGSGDEQSQTRDFGERSEVATSQLYFERYQESRVSGQGW